MVRPHVLAFLASRSDCLYYRFNPDFAKYGFAQWPGGLAHNAFNASELEPYTGRLKISDYLDDLQFPQMLDLALKYDTEIMVRFSSFVSNVALMKRVVVRYWWTEPNAGICCCIL
jgi:hypothetical protein